MSRIQQLPPDLVTKIAAGEVIERPASVIKELLENSIDAGATRIDIDLEQGGTELIRVVDNGKGIHPDDLALAFAAHATSKLRSADDLFNIHTMGFRGEALASIGGVGKVILQSRPPDLPHGAEIKVDGGILGDVRPWGGSAGTRIEVRHLFYSVPARKKFLKSMATELGRVTDVVEWLALANPNLHIVLRHNNKLVYDIPASASFTDRVALFFGGDVRNALYQIDSGPPSPQTGLRLHGWIGDPSMDRGNAKLQFLFVNGRWFRDRSLSYAISEAYRNLIMSGRYPAAFLFLTVPPDQVDVNAHPTKAEVRFRDNSVIFSLIRATIKERLLKENLVPKLTVSAPETIPAASPFSPRRELAEQTVAPWEKASSFAKPPLPPDLPFAMNSQTVSRTPSLPFSTHVEEDEDRLEDIPSFSRESESAQTSAATATTSAVSQPPTLVSDSRLNEKYELPFPMPAIPQSGTALQVHDAYLVLETPEGMIVIDQHALHERILFEQLRKRVREGKLEVQRLLIPEPIDLPANQVVAVLEAKEALAELGLEVAEFGGNTVILSSYPTLLSRRAPHIIFQGVVDYLVTKDQPPAKEVMLDHLLATMACKAAVKAGDKLTQEEIAHLLELRKMAEDSHHCPHGRPTSLLFSRQDLDRQFRRI